MASAKKPLTARQQEVLDYLRSRKTPPSLWEICAYFKWVNINAAVHHLDALERKKWIRRIPNQSRNIRLR
jgi:SOS-response transcriptional repressor LexA|tara:strand:+ start:219 stop:428 length:210 start_codon:yes stop_codon:yes gene_type:complete